MSQCLSGLIPGLTGTIKGQLGDRWCSLSLCIKQ